MSTTQPDMAATVAIAPWRSSLLTSLAKNRSLPYSKYMQLATTKTDGAPSCRTVVFRGFLDNTDSLTIVTDKRSRKVAEIAADPRAEVCWYFPETREQYRITGNLQVIQNDAQDADMLKARQMAWQNMSDAGRSQFTWPAPGLPRLEDQSEYEVPAPPAEAPAAVDFALVVLDVNEVELLSLLANRRWIYSRQTSGANTVWVEQEVNP